MNKAINLLEQLREFNDKPQSLWSSLSELSDLLLYEVGPALSELQALRDAAAPVLTD